MNKRLGALAVAGCMAALPVAASAQDWFVEGSAGAVANDTLKWGGSSYKTQTGFSGAVAVGRAINSDWDVAGQVSYDRMVYSCCTSNDTHEYRLMADVTRNFRLGPTAPYIGAGVGIANVTYHSSSYDRSNTVGAYQIIGGLRVPVSPALSLFGEYRYQNTFTNPSSHGLTWQQHGNNFAVGIRWKM